MTMVRVRFAPSPTGHLHIGAARTALFNWLFARHHKGSFILRIEDTDFARSSEKMSKGIIHGLEWLGLNWNEGPVFQSRRIALYQKKAEELIKKGKAYYCYCLPEEIQERKESVQKRGKYWKYDRRCLHLPEEEKAQFEKQGRAKAVRFLMPEKKMQYTDLVHGQISINTRHIEDFVLLRGDGMPTYHLSVVVDDLDLGITHVIRGDDHISNTPKQILLYEAFESKLPSFAHLPLILGPDKKKLSKRHGVTSVLQFKDEGYLPLAIVNFLAQMSWSPGKEERIYSMEEMKQKFSLENVSKGSPVFNLSKLDWLNGQLISQMSASDLFPLVQEELEHENLWCKDFSGKNKEWLMKLIDLLKERCRTLKDFSVSARPFLSDDFPVDSDGVEKYLKDERLPALLSILREDFATMDDFRAENIERVLRAAAEREGVKAALLIHALRMLTLGMSVSPGIFDVLELMGKEKTIERMSRLEQVRDFNKSSREKL